MYSVRIRRNPVAFATMTWSRHSRRIEPMTRSTRPFCQGERGAVGTASMFRRRRSSQPRQTHHRSLANWPLRERRAGRWHSRLPASSEVPSQSLQATALNPDKVSARNCVRIVWKSRALGRTGGRAGASSLVQSGARRHGIPGIVGNPGIVVSVSYRFYKVLSGSNPTPPPYLRSSS
jgi:hypothetical protein